MANSWAPARNERTGIAGSVQAQNVWVLSTLQKPEPEMIKLFKMSDLELEKLSRKNMSAAALEIAGNQKNFYNLQEYASEFFRKDEKSKVIFVFFRNK